MSATPPRSSAALFGSYLPEHLADRLAAGTFPPPGTAEKVWAIPLFSDVSGFTPLSEGLTRLGREGSERLNAILNRHFTRQIAITGEHGGSVVKFGGDAITVLFFPSPGEGRRDACRRVLHCAAEMQRAIDEYGEVSVPELGSSFRLRMKIGIAAGEIFQLLVGDANRLEFVPAGRPLDRMAESEHHAEAGEIVADEVVVQTSELDTFSPAGEGFAKLTVAPPPPESLPTRAPLPDDPALVERFAPFLHPALAGQLRATGAASLVAELRRATSIFIRFGGIDYDRDPEAFSKLHRYFLHAWGIISRFGGHLNQLATGDKGSVLHVIFGAPVFREDNELHAVLASMTLRDETLPFISGQKIGINSGGNFCGNIGAEARREYTALGDATNLAARLMQAAAENSVLCSQSIQEKAKSRIDFDVLPVIRVKGKTGLIPVFSPRALRTGTAPVRELPPLVGRDAELARALALADSAKAGRGRWLHLEGEAGTGKTRLSQAILDRLGPAFSHASGLGLAWARDSAYLPWASVIASRIGIPPDAPEAERRSALGEAIGRFRPGHPEDAGLVAGALGWWNAGESAGVDESVRPQRIRQALEELILADRSPLCIVLDDAHWLDAASRDLVLYLGRNVEQVPLLLVTIARPESTATEVSDLPGRSVIALEPLPKPAIAELSREILRGSDVPGDIVDLVADRSRGNPLYAGEILRHLVATSGILRDEDSGRLYLNPRFTQAMLPENVNDLILARMDALPEVRRQVLRVASVFGRSFELADLAVVLPIPMPERELEDSVGELATLGLTTADDESRRLYSFDHILVQEVAYESLAFERRRSIHGAIARRIETVAGADAARHAAILSHHFGRARIPEPAFRYGMLAAEAALSAFANEEARHHLSSALALLPEAEPDRDRRSAHERELLGKRASVLFRLGMNHEAFADRTRVFSKLHAGGDFAAASEACHELSRIAEAESRFPRAAALARSAARFANRTASHGRLVDALTQLAVVRWRTGDFAGSLASFEAVTPEHLPPAAAGRVLLSYGITLRDAGRHEKALEMLLRSLDTARLTKDATLEISAATNLSNLFALRNRLPEAATALDDAERKCREIGDHQRLVHVLFNRSGLELAAPAPDLRKAASILNETLHWASRFGLDELTATAQVNLGALAFAEGRFDDALACYRRGYALHLRIGSRWAISTLANIAEVLVTTGDPGAEAELVRVSEAAAEKKLGDVERWANAELGKLRAAARSRE